MKNKIIVLIIAIVILLILVKLLTNKKENLIRPEMINATSTPTEVKYDSSTDLEKELDSVNPQVLDTDFVVE